MFLHFGVLIKNCSTNYGASLFSGTSVGNNRQRLQVAIRGTLRSRASTTLLRTITNKQITATNKQIRSISDADIFL